MGNYRFRLTAFIPNTWFYKLRDMGKSRKHSKNNATSPSHTHAVSTTPRISYYHSRGLAQKTLHPPRKSTKRCTPAADAKFVPKQVSSTVSSACSCRAKVWAGKSVSTPTEFSTTSGDTLLTESFSPDLRSDHVLVPDESLDNNSGSWPSPCSCSSKATALKKNDGKSCKSPEIELRPIITGRPTAKKETNKRNGRKASTKSPGVRVRQSSPRVVSGRRSFSGGRRSVSTRSITEGRAVVKKSENPQKDFKESMVEMIVENNIRASKDLEDLLASYLSLNSTEYHDIIIEVFKQIWVDLTALQQLQVTPS